MSHFSKLPKATQLCLVLHSSEMMEQYQRGKFVLPGQNTAPLVTELYDGSDDLFERIRGNPLLQSLNKADDVALTVRALADIAAFKRAENCFITWRGLPLLLLKGPYIDYAPFARSVDLAVASELANEMLE
jgi:hypothetical protein